MSILERILQGEFNGVFIDSRQPIADGLFIPIRGEKFNGNSFIRAAFDGGAKAALVERSYYDENQAELAGLDLYIVEDSMLALQHLAFEVRQAVDPIVIGVTGSNGKTTLKNMLAQLCASRYRTYATKGNFNNTIGLPLMVLNMPLDTELLILEMGMSEAGEIARLSEITQPDLAAITNIGSSHIEFFSGMEGILAAKLEILQSMPPEAPVFINDDDPLLHTADYGSHPVVRCRRDQLEAISSTDGFYRYRWRGLEIELKLRGEHQLDNSLLALSIAHSLGISDSDLVAGISAYQGADMRFDTVDFQGITVINDAYNASPLSMLAALKTLLSMEGQRKIAVLGDIFELGKMARSEHSRIGQFEGIEQLDGLFTIGDFARYIAPEHPRGLHFSNMQRLSQHLVDILRPGDVVLVKASRGMELERVVRYLEEYYA